MCPVSQVKAALTSMSVLTKVHQGVIYNNEPMETNTTSFELDAFSEFTLASIPFPLNTGTEMQTYCTQLAQQQTAQQAAEHSWTA